MKILSKEFLPMTFDTQEDDTQENVPEEFIPMTFDTRVAEGARVVLIFHFSNTD